MSLRIPTLGVTKYQRFSDKIEFRFYNDNLFICKVEDDGRIIKGANLMLDSLPAAAIYGDNGSAESFVLSSEVNLDVDFDLLSAAEKTQLENALKDSILAGISIEGAIVLITSMTSTP